MKLSQRTINTLLALGMLFAGISPALFISPQVDNNEYIIEILKMKVFDLEMTRLPDGTSLTVITTVTSLTEIEAMHHGFNYDTTWTIGDPLIWGTDDLTDTTIIDSTFVVDSTAMVAGKFEIVCPYFTDTVLANQPSVDMYGVFSARVKEMCSKPVEAVLILRDKEWQKFSYKFR